MIFECSDELKMKYRTRNQTSDPSTWHPPLCALKTPQGGVTLPQGGLFRSFFARNAEYLLSSFSVDEMLYAFRLRAGQKEPPAERDIFKLFGFWTEGLRGSETGRFLMGAANTLQWIEHPELLNRLKAVVDGIAECQEADGYVFAFDRDKPKYWEQGNYARNWFTQGMVDAGVIYPKALEVMRRGQDWFNQCDWLPNLIYLSLGLQGHPANLSMYFSPVGKPEDVQVAEKYYVQDWWLDQLLAHDPAAIWKYSLNRPHCYEIAGFEAYFDHYLATGDRKFLDAMTAAFDLMRDNWQHIGGAWAICEGKPYPPQSYRLDCTGELCGSVFWIKFCQRFQRLYPDAEKYVGEIEKSLYNVVFANQAEDGIRYHALLDGHKEKPAAGNTCCEVHGTRIYAALPEYIYSLTEAGITVNLFEASTIEAFVAGKPVRLTLETCFPFDNDVKLTVAAASRDGQPVRSPGCTGEWTLRLRVPAWAAKEMPVRVNGETVATGHPGSFLSIARAWRDGDVITFTVPAAFRMTRYPGEDTAHWSERWALEYGPVLMAFVGPLEEAGEGRRSVIIRVKQEDLMGRLQPIQGRPLHFRITGLTGYEVMPYWQVGYESFSAVPVVRP
jgi:hypothetical protein